MTTVVTGSPTNRIAAAVLLAALARCGSAAPATGTGRPAPYALATPLVRWAMGTPNPPMPPRG